MDDVSLSKTIAHALRHKPECYGLVLDDVGSVDVYLLLAALRKLKEFSNVNIEDIYRVVANDKKGRYAILDNKIRAISGHSFKQKIIHKEKEPPKVLFHGTSHAALGSIMKSGLLPMKRQYVHLSSNIDIALEVGKRKDDNPVILVIDTINAKAEGVIFYESNSGYLSTPIPAKFIKEYKL